MREIDELNTSESRQPPNEMDILRLERLIGSKLPETYVKFIRRANGGHPELDTFVHATNGEWGINNFFFIGEEDGSTASVEWNFVYRWEGIPKEFLPFARDGGDNIFLLNLTEEHEEEVWLWVHDIPSENLLKLADTLEEFIDGLSLNPDYI